MIMMSILYDDDDDDDVSNTLNAVLL